mgnify:FL=1
MVRSCYKRLDALDDEQLRQEFSSALAEIATVALSLKSYRFCSGIALSVSCSKTIVQH